MRLLILALLLVVAGQAVAQPHAAGPTVALFAPVATIEPGGTTTSSFIPVGYSTRLGLSWTLNTTASVNVSCTVLQSNAVDGTYSQWSSVSPGVGTTNHNIFTITTAEDGTDLSVVPSAFLKVQLFNADSEKVTPTQVRLYSR